MMNIWGWVNSTTLTHFHQPFGIKIILTEFHFFFFFEELLFHLNIVDIEGTHFFNFSFVPFYLFVEIEKETSLQAYSELWPLQFLYYFDI